MTLTTDLNCQPLNLKITTVPAVWLPSNAQVGRMLQFSLVAAFCPPCVCVCGCVCHDQTFLENIINVKDALLNIDASCPQARRSRFHFPDSIMPNVNKEEKICSNSSCQLRSARASNLTLFSAEKEDWTSGQFICPINVHSGFKSPPRHKASNKKIHWVELSIGFIPKVKHCSCI